jgi:hypothetical protein
MTMSPHSLNDIDLELLEAYLDGELPQGPTRDALVQRLEADRALAEALEALRAERFVRAQAFQSMEPDERSAEQFAWVTTQSLRHGSHAGSPLHRDFWTWSNTALRTISAAAACVVIGFLIGFMTRGTPSSAPVPGPDPSAPTQVQNAGYNVALTNERGEVVAVQRFDSPDKAREFANDVDRWQRQQQLPPRASPTSRQSSEGGSEQF